MLETEKSLSTSRGSGGKLVELDSPGHVHARFEVGELDIN